MLEEAIQALNGGSESLLKLTMFADRLSGLWALALNKA